MRSTPHVRVAGEPGDRILSPVQQAAADMTTAADDVLAEGQIETKAAPVAQAEDPDVAPAARNLSAVLSGTADGSARSPLQNALEGTGRVAQAPSGGAFDGGSRTLPRPVASQAAQQAAARRLVQALDGMLKPGQKPEITFLRAAVAGRRFNEFVAVAEPSFLQAPPPEFILVHQVLVKMLSAPGN